MRVIKTADLIGPALNWAVAKCKDLRVIIRTNPSRLLLCDGDNWEWEYEPSIDWAEAGPIIEYMQIELRYHHVIVAGIWYWDGSGSDKVKHKQIGATPLIAAMRCYVASKLGEEVEVPDELAPL